jgi:ketosteroid isomerase-like protein
MTLDFVNDSFDDFLKSRENAARAYVTGAADLLLGMTASTGPAGFVAPDGTIATGAPQVRHAFTDGIEAFGPDSTTHFEILEKSATEDTAWWTGYQRATMQIDGEEGPVPTKLCVTEIFHKTADGWKLVHRHASPASTSD